MPSFIRFYFKIYASNNSQIGTKNQISFLIKAIKLILSFYKYTTILSRSISRQNGAYYHLFPLNIAKVKNVKSSVLLRSLLFPIPGKGNQTHRLLICRIPSKGLIFYHNICCFAILIDCTRWQITNHCAVFTVVNSATIFSFFSTINSILDTIRKLSGVYSSCKGYSSLDAKV